MQFFTFSLLMLGLALTAQFRSPQFGKLPIVWFFLSWLPGELPWAFAALHAIAIVIYLGMLLPEQNITYLHIFSLVISSGTLCLWYSLHRKTFRAKDALAKALREGLETGRETANNTSDKSDSLIISANSVSEYRHWLKPFSFKREGVERLSNIAYGPHPRQQLDIVRLSNISPAQGLRPVLLHIHGGAWILGHKQQQALPLLNYLAQQGWICVEINYRLAPAHRFPDFLADVKLAIAWLKTNIHTFAGDPAFIAISGGSAGGHLCALTALTANQPEFQPGFETADTRVQAAIPLYGLYDFTNSSGTASGEELNKFFTRYIMPAPYALQPELWRKASPLLQVDQNAPPMFIIQGSNDCLALVEETRLFVAALKQQSRAPVLYVEIEGAQHGFEIFHAVRTEFTLEAIGTFLLHCYRQSRKASI